MCENEILDSLHTQLPKAEETADAASRAHNEFLAKISHEIRTAMNSIIGMTDAVLASDLTPEQQNDLNVVKDSAHSLLQVIDFIQSQSAKS